MKNSQVQNNNKVKSIFYFVFSTFGKIDSREFLKRMDFYFFARSVVLISHLVSRYIQSVREQIRAAVRCEGGGRGFEMALRQWLKRLSTTSAQFQIGLNLGFRVRWWW